MATDKELLQEAMRALLKGDTKKRDELCDQVKRRIDAREAESIKIAEAAKPYFPKH